MINANPEVITGTNHRFPAPTQVMACREGKKWQDGEHYRFGQARKTPEQPVAKPFPDPVGVLKVENNQEE